MNREGRSLTLCLVALAAACSDAPTTGRAFAVLADADSSDWALVVTGRDHTCALKRDGRAFCWGSNRLGQLAIGQADSTCSVGTKQVQCMLVPTLVALPVRFTSLTAGADHTCGLTATGDAFCWGANIEAQLGEYSFSESGVQEIQSAIGWSKIAAGDAHTCALRTDGAVFCWGDNREGQAGIGIASGPSSPLRARMPVPAVDVSAGDEQTCARARDGTLYCWGALWVSRDSAGNDSMRAQPSPQLVPGAPAFAGFSVGGGATCGFDVTGFGYCWGANDHGEAGAGTLAGSTSPQRIASTIDLTFISAGEAQACGLDANGAGYCWGDDTYGQLGASGSAVAERCTMFQLPCSSVPVPVFGAQKFTMISTGLGSHTCGVTTRGNLYCWGNGSVGQRGDGTRRPAQDIPIKVAEPQ